MDWLQLLAAVISLVAAVLSLIAVRRAGSIIKSQVVGPKARARGDQTFSAEQ